MSEKRNAPNPLGITFLVLGVAMTATFGAAFGPAFLGLGAPFIVLGIVFMGRKQADETAQGDK